MLMIKDAVCFQNKCYLTGVVNNSEDTDYAGQLLNPVKPKIEFSVSFWVSTTCKQKKKKKEIKTWRIF